MSLQYSIVHGVRKQPLLSLNARIQSQGLPEDWLPQDLLQGLLNQVAL